MTGVIVRLYIDWARAVALVPRRKLPSFKFVCVASCGWCAGGPRDGGVKVRADAPRDALGFVLCEAL